MTWAEQMGYMGTQMTASDFDAPHLPGSGLDFVVIFSYTYNTRVIVFNVV